ncbi:sigma-E factor negative regulatory protein [Thiohalophilus sp.]|uniref:sigma-E factor negative regulatory protein n=1 Tax=Thiohalophilus sp. TaxID=3028392 RepID=UPI0039758CC3
MSNNSDETLSAFMDDEYHSQVLESLKQDSEVRARWTRYHLIRDVLSGHSQSVPAPDFADRVSAALQKEPTTLRPAARRIGEGFRRQVAGLAIAATVATVAVLTVQQGNPGDIPAPQMTVASTQTGSEEYLAVSGNPAPSQQPIDSEVQSKLSSYLVNHNEYSISSRMQGMLPYMRIVSVTPSQRVAGADEK